MLAASPDAVEVRFNRAGLLTELGRTDEAKSAYIELLAKEPGHLGALSSLGRLLYASGYRMAAHTVYTQAVAMHPGSADAHVNLADVLAQQHEIELAMEHYETALRLDPDHIQAHRGMADVLVELRHEDRAAAHRQKGYQDRPLLEIPFYGEGTPITVVMLVSATGGMVRIQHHLDSRVFHVWVVFVEYFDPSTPLPEHQLIFNAIGNADRCGPALEAADRILANTSAPVINQPSKVALTSRVETARRMGAIDGVVTPKTSLVERTFLESADASSRLADQGFGFPLLLRSPGYHTGRYFMRIENEKELAVSLQCIPGEEILAIQFLDARGVDGKIRKYRAMIVDGALYPLHLAIAQDWKVHYFTAEMADSPGHRAEDAAFLDDMGKALGPRAMGALEKVRETLDLEYGGVDFSVSPAGDVILFEANASMVVYSPDKDPRWDYRRPAVQRVLDAIRQMLTKSLPLQ